MTKTRPGKFYGVTAAGRMLETGPGVPDTVICRRVADFPEARVPDGGAVGTCVECSAAIVFNPRGPYQDRPRVCLQCRNIAPLPFDDEDPRP